MRTRLTQIHDFILDLVFPRRCFGCGKEDAFLCAACCEKFPRLEAPFCNHCGLPIEEDTSCSKCASTPLEIDGIRSLFRHDGLARDAVHSLKYNNIKALAQPLAQLMTDYLTSTPLPVDCVISVPMHSKRIRKRGYNQAELLASEIVQSGKLRKAKGTLLRLKNTPSQVSLGADDRRNNVKEAFKCADQAFLNQRILLIDDVCTTGATLNACAIALKDAGATAVWGLTISRDC